MSEDQNNSDSGNAPADPKPRGASPIDPKKVMEDALSSIVRRADEAAGIPTPAGEGGDAGERTTRKKRKRKRKPRPEGAPARDGGSSGDRGEGPRGRKKRTREGGGGGGSATSHASDAVRSMASMVKKLLDSKKVHFLRRPRHMELKLKIPLDAGRDGAKCAGQLVDEVLALIEQVQKNETAQAPGSVYCYFSESAEAEGCRPAEPRQVFDGYGSTGRPKFTDFVTMAIDRKAKGIEGLVGGDDVTLTHVTQGRVLRTAQLAEFGKASPVFRILGQVDAGLFAVRRQEAKAAFSFQVLLGKDLQGHPVLRLHPVGKCDVMELVDSSVAQILHRFQGDLDDAALRLRGMQANGDETDEEEFVLPMLQTLAKQLEDRAKHRSRRTEHAEKRSQKSTRPTDKAYTDAQSVGDEDLLWDGKDGTFVVVGRHSRVHVFTPEGRHVTSLSNIGRSGVQQRLKSNRWRATEPGERGEFRMQLRAMVKSHREESERSSIEKSARKDASGEDAAAEPGHLQSKLAAMMSGLGEAAAPEGEASAGADASPEAGPAPEASADDKPTEIPTPEPEPPAETKDGADGGEPS